MNRTLIASVVRQVIAAFLKPKTGPARSIMYLGDSISVNSIGMNHFPRNQAVRYVDPTLTNINAGGFFIITLATEYTCPTGNGTLRYFADDSTMTWQAFGDTEGPRTPIVMEKCFYKLESGTSGKGAFISAVPRVKPAVDKSDTFNVAGTVKLRNHCASSGIVGWTNTLLGNPFDEVYPFAIATIRATDWWAARSQWEGIKTDVTHIFLGTNTPQGRVGRMEELAAVENIIRSRLDSGSAVVVGSIMPYDEAVADQVRNAVEFNIRLRVLCMKLGVQLWDANPYVGTPAGAGLFKFLPGMSSDGLHPSNKAGYVIAKRAIAPLIKPLVRDMQSRPFANAKYDAALAPYGNLLPMGVSPGGVTGVLCGISASALSAGVSGQIPDGWALTREASSANVTATSIAPDSASAIALTDGTQVKPWTITMSNSAGINGEGVRARLAQWIGSGFAEGDYVVLEGEMMLSGTGIQAFSVALSSFGGAGAAAVAIEANAQSTSPIDNLDGDTIRVPFRTQPIRVDSATTGIQPGFVVYFQAGGSATLSILPTGLSVHKVPAP